MRFFLLSIFLILLFSCKKNSSDNILAEVYDYKLMYDDVIYNMPSNISDTNLYIKKIIDDWISEKVLLNQAMINIDDNSDELESKIINYKSI